MTTEEFMNRDVMVGIIKFPISCRDLFPIVKLYSVQSVYSLPSFSFTVKTLP